MSHELLGVEFRLANMEAERLAEKAETLALTGDYVQALGSLEKARTYIEGSGEHEKRDLLNLSTAIAGVELILAGPDKAALGIEDALASAVDAVGPKSPVRAQAVLSLALIRAVGGRVDEAEELVAAALPVIEEIYGTNHFAYATGLQAVMMLQALKANPTKAREAAERSNMILAQTVGTKDPRYAMSLALLAQALAQEGQITQAEATCKRSVELMEEVSPSPASLSMPLEAMANIYGSEAKYDQALRFARRNLENLAQAGKEYRFLLAGAYYRMGVVQLHLGDYGMAAEALRNCVAIYEPVLGAENFLVGGALGLLGSVWRHLGLYAEAEALIRRSLSTHKRTFGEDSIFVAEALLELAGVYADQGWYSSAEPLVRRSLAIMEKLYGPEHMYVAACLIELAQVLAKQGQVTSAASACMKSLEIHEKSLGPDHPATAKCLDLLARFRTDSGDYGAALDVLTRCLRIRLNTFGTNAPVVGDTLADIGVVFLEAGDYTNALFHFKMGMDIKRATLGEEHPDLAANLSLLAAGWERLGRPEISMNLSLRALDLEAPYRDPLHLDVLMARDNVAVLALQLRNYSEALDIYVASRPAWRLFCISQLEGVERKQASQMVRNETAREGLLQYHLADAPPGINVQAARFRAESSALNKALLEELEAAHATLERDSSKSTREIREAASAARLELSRLPSVQLEASERKARRRRLYDQLEMAETKLAERDRLVAQAVGERTLRLLDLARDLSPAVLVDFAQYRRCDFATRKYSWKERRYAAYLTFPLAKDSTNVVVERVDMGEAAPIDQAVAELHRLIKAGQIAPQRLGPVIQRLSDLVYAPLAKHVTNVEHLIVCPDGQLNRLPFELLRHGGKYLVETKTVTYVTSGREVARLGAESQSQKPTAKSQRSRSLVMGNPDFNLDLAGSAGPVLVADRRAGSRIGIEPATGSSAETNGLSAWLASLPPSAAEVARTRGLSRSFFTEPGATNSTVRDAAARGLVFEPLPQAEAEARSVAALLGEEAVLRVGREAREAELKSTNSPRVLHLATHGFFLPDQEFRATNLLRDSWLDVGGALGTGGLNRRRFGPPGEAWENPLVRCGLALAGANRALQITNAVAEDGLLTGLEASLLNLQGTELVILSACDTGSGDVKIGEGVMSLRRAFRIAGAETVLASHWPVNDQATKLLMTEFIRRWRAGTPRGQAWREAQLELLRSQDYANPYFWAAFTLTGQWR